MDRPVSFDNCSLICRVGFGVRPKADLSTSSWAALIVVLGPRRLLSRPPSTIVASYSCESESKKL